MTFFSKCKELINDNKQAGAELCQAQAQLGWQAEATTKQNLHLNG